MIKTFSVPVKGVGRRDYSKMVEHSIEPFVTIALTQMVFAAQATFTLAGRLFPGAWISALPMPQEDGTWGWLASSIPCIFYNVSVSIKTNSLVVVGLRNYASIADYFSNTIHKRFGETFSYGEAKLKFSKGVVTEEGYLYAVYYGAWPVATPYELTFTAHGMISELTPPWIEYAP